MRIIKWNEVKPSELSDKSFLFLKRIIGMTISQLYDTGERDILCVVLYPHAQEEYYKCRFINEPVTKFEDCEFDLLAAEFIQAENCQSGG
jgi:hypothetical protein